MNTAVPALAFPRAADRVHPRCVAALMSAGSVAAAGTLQLTGLHWGKKELVHTVPQQSRPAARGVAVLASIPPLRVACPRNGRSAFTCRRPRTMVALVAA